MRLPSELGIMHLSPAKTERTFGLRPSTRLRDGLAREWEWLQNNPHRWSEMHY
jgi:hypothetical protein